MNWYRKLLGITSFLTLLAISGCGSPAPQNTAGGPTTTPTTAATTVEETQTLSPSAVPSASGTLTGTIDVTDDAGYSATYSYDFQGTTWSLDPAQATPGQTDLSGEATGTVTITNTTPKRQNPLTPTGGQLALEVIGLYPSTAAVCGLGPRLEFLYRVRDTGPELCGVAFAYFHPLTGGFTPLAPGEARSVDQRVGALVAKGLKEAEADQIMKELNSPPQVVVKVPGGFTSTATSCKSSARNAASGRWDTSGTWVVPEGQRSPC